ncbi:MAG: hypothetical protein KDK36_08175, partial [Leptospiraceae bacterium]|nr:hypothetical protein [Leptospiraceae bacterium]
NLLTILLYLSLNKFFSDGGSILAFLILFKFNFNLSSAIGWVETREVIFFTTRGLFYPSETLSKK